MYTLAGKRYLVTGASSGIGRAVAVALSNSGARVLISGRSPENLEQTAMAMPTGSVEICVLDLKDVEEISPWLDGLRERYGVLDGIAHCAGVQVTQTVRDFDLDTFNTLMHVNTASVLALAQGLRKLRKKLPGAMVLTASVGCFIGQPSNVIYGASKAAVVSLTRGLAMELLRDQIRVNCVAPALVESPMTASLAGEIGEARYQSIVDRHPMGVGQPEDVANAMLFLLSDHARWINGVTLPVDGGYLAR